MEVIGCDAGLGYANFFVSALLCTYYNVVISWTLSYLYNSLTTSALPWEGCSNDFNSECKTESKYILLRSVPFV